MHTAQNSIDDGQTFLTSIVDKTEEDSNKEGLNTNFKVRLKKNLKVTNNHHNSLQKENKKSRNSLES